MQHMDGNIPLTFYCWADPGVHLLILHVVVGRQFSTIFGQMVGPEQARRRRLLRRCDHAFGGEGEESV